MDRRFPAPDELATGAVERRALAELRGASGGSRPMEEHCRRVLLVALALAEREKLAVDREVLGAAAWLHDIGVYPAAMGEEAYVTEGRRHAEGLLRDAGWEGERARRCLDAIELHHTLRPQWARGAEVELLRRADLVDVTAGLVTFGLDRGWLRALAAASPRAGFARELGRAARRLARHGALDPRGIVAPRRP